MPNMSIENLTRSIQTGDTESFMGGSPAMSEFRVTQEARKNGLELGGVGGVEGAGGAHGAGGKNFADIMRDSVAQVNQHQAEADTAIKELVAGRSKNIHETMLAIERADSSLKLMMQVRNKVLDAYREIMRMQI